MFGKDLRFIVICLMLFLVGGLLRLQAGWSPRLWSAAAGSVSVEELSDEQLAELNETVLKFYKSIDTGNYEEAYQLAFENKWQKSEGEEYALVGLTSEEEFVSRLTAEIGNNGMRLNIIGIEVLGQSPLPPEHWTPEERPELYALQHLPSEAWVGSVYEVEVGGVLLERCSRWNWFDKVLVAHTQDNGEWKLLLPGGLDPNRPHHIEWFRDGYPF